ncbi:major facilitator superfamily domain-containing protein [Talaromyces proteolyticus]|uniref:Major facilitator superfamily domain-containing protein n=1 Tax=Talaromyces proteolyticus TaxID=1131652 RepID=A0AAD4Q182_9EURO|nr:major facilitator superfamily domain-containing protein [Talaromyces proteolyticus]KAH8697983.1 major facilitator superfamily domain-containing protein [Talaromyces proteolyticus]
MAHVHRSFKRRWIGLIQLVLLNIITTWDWVSFAASAGISAEYFGVSESDTNWLSIAFLGGFCVFAPGVIYLVPKFGIRSSCLAAAILLLAGNWIRYVGAVAREGGIFGLVMFGQILIGISSAFVLPIPTSYSQIWFTEKGRVKATAVATLASPLGAALGQLISPLWMNSAGDVPRMILWTSILSSISSIPTIFVPDTLPARGPSSAAAVLGSKQQLSLLIHSLQFWFLFIPFSVYVGLFNALTTLLDQILGPYGATESEAGICGAILIASGIVSAIIVSLLVDISQSHVLVIKALSPIIAICYLIFRWIPDLSPIMGAYIVSGSLGAASFALVPVVLEWLVDATFPVGAEFTSTICWIGGQFMGIVSVLVMNAFKEDGNAAPPYNMKQALTFQAVLGAVVCPLPMLVGVFGGLAENRRHQAGV